MSFKRGFTLVEMLLVVAIMAMLLSVTFVLYQQSKAKSRDARREHDIKEMQNALDLYVTNVRLFPICNEGIINGVSDCLSEKLIAAGAMVGLPVDPLHKAVGVCDGAGSHVYCYESANGFSYTLKYSLETDTIPGKVSGWQSVSP